MNIQRICALLIKNENRTACEIDEIKELYKSLGFSAILETVTKRKIIPFAAKTLSELDLDKDKWDEIIESYRKRNENIVSFLDKVYETLREFGVTKITVSENFGALLSADDDLSQFASGDIDNYAPISEKEKIYAAMESLGFTKTERFSVNNQIAAEFFPPKNFNLPDKFYFSVDFYPLARLKLPCFIREENFINWNECYYYKNTAIRLISPTSLMYICMLHVSLHSFMRAPDYRLYLDLYNLSKCDIDYDRIRLWCEKENTALRASVSAILSNLIMSTDIPTDFSSRKSRIDRLVNYTYDKNLSALKPEPGKIKILKIDTMCHDESDFCGLISMLFPDKNWVIKTYGNRSIVSYIKHFIRMI